MSEIYERWGNGEILNYGGALYGFVRVEEWSVEKVESSEKVIELIEKDEKFEGNVLKDI
ncbi:hypothetical protein [Priestia megaterium]|uniref:hypothetical protein n=1 Tax=Priestia megaterium TaxID=1404 RepID=UPI001649EA62|nr:hypothetical protein [Priestia megaterium]